MKAIINGKRYNTETATLVAEYWNGIGKNNFRYVSEDLYITKNGSWFMAGSGGAMTSYAKRHGNCTYGSQAVRTLTSDEAYAWLEDHDETIAIESYFPDLIKDA